LVTTQPLPLPLSTLLPKTLPLLSDPSSSVRSSVLKFLRILPVSDLDAHVPTLLLHIRAGLTHLALDIRLDSLEALRWLLSVQGEEVVACEGGWIKTLKCFLAVLGWERADTAAGQGKWSRAPKASFGRVGEGEGRVVIKALEVLGVFLKAGLVGSEEGAAAAEEEEISTAWPPWQVQTYELPQKKNAFARLNLFGVTRGEIDMMYEDREDRVAVFVRMGFRDTVENGLEASKREAGEVGRAAAGVLKVLGEGMDFYEA
jgi:pre-rRNA-processing protein IPI1